MEGFFFNQQETDFQMNNSIIHLKLKFRTKISKDHNKYIWAYK